MFKMGDKIRCIDDRVVDGGYPPGLERGEVYTVMNVHTVGDIARVCVKGVQADALYQTRFVSTKISNEERIAKRMEELHA